MDTLNTSKYNTNTYYKCTKIKVLYMPGAFAPDVNSIVYFLEYIVFRRNLINQTGYYDDMGHFISSYSRRYKHRGELPVLYINIQSVVQKSILNKRRFQVLAGWNTLFKLWILISCCIFSKKSTRGCLFKTPCVNKKERQMLIMNRTITAGFLQEISLETYFT